VSIDIDKNFRKVKNRPKHYRSRKEQLAAVREMKKCLLNGLSCKVASIVAGYEMRSGMTFFKEQTGKTMGQFRDEHNQHPQ
jgi:hypothetical protein